MEKYGVHQERPKQQPKTPGDREKLADGERGLCPQCGRDAVWHGVWHCASCGTAPWEVPPCTERP